MPQEFEIEKNLRRARLTRLHFFIKLDNSWYFEQLVRIDNLNSLWWAYPNQEGLKMERFVNPLEHPDDTLCEMFGPLGEKPAASLVAIDERSNVTTFGLFHEPQARNEAGWDDEKESKMREIIHAFLRRFTPRVKGYTGVKLIWYRAGNMLSQEEIPV